MKIKFKKTGNPWGCTHTHTHTGVLQTKGNSKKGGSLFITSSLDGAKEEVESIME